jgi:chromosome segregation ATPase
MQQLEGNLKDKNLIVDEYKGKNDDLLSIVAEYKQFKVELEEYKKLLADSQTRSIDLSNSIREKDYNINQLNKIVEKLPQDHQKDLEQLNKENALNIKLAVSEVKEDLNNKLSQEQFKYNKEIELYQLKYKDLLEELEKKRTIPKDIKKVKGNITTI